MANGVLKSFIRELFAVSFVSKIKNISKYRIRQIIFFENALKKKTTEYFSNFFSYLKVQSFRLIMENNFIQMAASAGHVVAYAIGPIFKHIIDCVQLYFSNGFTNIILESVNCLWL